MAQECVGQRTYRAVLYHCRDRENGRAAYTVEVPALGGCVTEGDDLAEALYNAREAIELYLETLAADGTPPPEDRGPLTVEAEDTDDYEVLDTLILKVAARVEAPEVEVCRFKGGS